MDVNGFTFIKYLVFMDDMMLNVVRVALSKLATSIRVDDKRK